jgi:ATP-dependent protease HslVU (ClpYQ) peptidase subunit
MSVTQFEQYYAIGSGAPYALGATHALYKETADAEVIARKAAEAAMALDLYCGGSVTAFAMRAATKRKKRR